MLRTLISLAAFMFATTQPAQAQEAEVWPRAINVKVMVADELPLSASVIKTDTELKFRLHGFQIQEPDPDEFRETVLSSFDVVEVTAVGGPRRAENGEVLS